MNENLLKLEPAALWQNFRELTLIPRPSKKEAASIEYVVNFAKKHNLEYIVDEVGNVIVKKPATPGFENRKGVVFQGHLDMVPQKNSDKNHDFEKDPIETIVDGDWVKANGTTLGADNGIGCAAALAVLESKTLQHGPVEALFTIDEETGMTGAFGLKAGVLKGDILLNLDTEDEGELYVGCAGGTNANVKFCYTETAVPANVVAYKISVMGLKGGHSGCDIHLGRGNANKVLFRFMYAAQKEFGLRVAYIDGGSLRNAIPREAFATVVVPASNAEKFEKSLNNYTEIVKKELSVTEPTLSITFEKIATPEKLIDEVAQKAVINSVYSCPNGVIRMSDSMAGLVETSNNLASVKMKNPGEIAIQCLMRSSVDSSKEDLGQMLSALFEVAGGQVVLDGAYPGWKPNMDSAILKTMQGVYNKMYGKIPEIKAIHAGLECGLLGGVYPNWDMISFGPTIRFPHSPDEKVNIESVKKFWDFLVETLKNIPVK